MSVPTDRPDLDPLLDRALQVGGETDGFDFKEVLDFQKNGEHKIKLLKAIGAFCNADKGGHIIIGVTNERRVVGIPLELAQTYDQTPIQRMAGDYFAPQPALQVRRHQRDGKELVFIEVSPFREIPSVVKRYEVSGKEKLQDGTFLTRTGAAESAVLTNEAELRRLCDAIAARRATAIAELVNLGTAQDEEARQRSAALKALRVVRAEADRMQEHARQVNAGSYHGFAEQYLPLLLRPSLLESLVPQIIDEVQKSSILQRNLALLRTAAAAADEDTVRLLESGGDLGRLRPLLLNVMNSAAMVSGEIERMLR